jgi:FlaA1/EpsC-like NDP-sugar epimerase
MILKDIEKNKWLLAAADLIAVNLALWGAFALRFEGGIIEPFRSNFGLMALLVSLLRMVILWRAGAYRGVWRYAGLADLLTIAKAISLGSVIILATTWSLFPSLGYPRSVIIIEWLGDVILIGGARMVFRLWSHNRRQAEARKNPQNRTLIVGAGDAGEMVVRQMLAHPEYGYIPVGFVDDDPRKKGLKIHGLPILGSRRELDTLLEKRQADTIVIAIPSAPGLVIKETVEQCQQAGICFKIVPGIKDIIEGEVNINQIRNIELDDLLRRPPVNLDLKGMAGYLSEKTVLVTGAGGSIGSELCRQIAGFGPQRLLLLGKGENSLYHIAYELAEKFSELEIKTLICDVTDAIRVENIFREHKPDVVFHAAAHKHVPMMEQNPGEAVKNNVFGTRALATACLEHKVDRLVLISTDKAVNPTSVMGATKRISEKVVMSLNGRGHTKFMAVRFGNVLGSNGSVVPLFKKQIAAGGPVTVTHPEIERYFMTIPEAVQLVIQAGAMGKGGEVFVLDMGQPVKIVDLARDMIRLSGKQLDTEIRIEFTGLRKGEKLCEELLTAEEGINATKHSQIFVVKGRHAGLDQLPKLLPLLKRAAEDGGEGKVVAAIKKVIPNFRKEH